MIRDRRFATSEEMIIYRDNLAPQQPGSLLTSSALALIMTYDHAKDL